MKNTPFGKFGVSKGFASIWLVVFVVVVAAGFGYFAFKNSGTYTLPQQSQNQASPKSEGTISIISPRRGEKLIQGKTSPIKWSGGTGTIGIQILDSKDNYVGWVTETESNGEFAWDPANYEEYNPTIKIPLKTGQYKLEIGTLNPDMSTFCGSALKYPCQFLTSGFSGLFEVVSPNETADWQTYRNEKHGFEIKYPKTITFSGISKGEYNWQSAGIKDGIPTPLVFDIEIDNPNGLFGGHIIPAGQNALKNILELYLNTVPKPENFTSFENYAKLVEAKQLESKTQNPSGIFETKIIKLNGGTAIEVTEGDPGELGIVNKSVIFQNSKALYRLSYNPHRSRLYIVGDGYNIGLTYPPDDGWTVFKEQSNKLMEKIIGTFQFFRK